MPNIAVPAGLWRWPAAGLVLIACLGGVLVLAAPAASGWAGLSLLGGLAVTGAVLLFGLLPRTRGSAQSERVAEAAAKANIAWAITSADGAVVECNDAYRRIAAVAKGEATTPPELALSSEASAAMLYRLARAASAGHAHEERCTIASGIDMLAMVRPLADRHTAWWFTPVLSVGAAPAAETKSSAPAAALSLAALFEDAPIGIATADRDGNIAEANKTFAAFFAVSDLAHRALGELVDSTDRQKLTQILSAAEGNRATVEIRPATGADRLAELYAEPLHGAADNVILYLVDVSEQKALETKFAQSQKMQAVGQLAGGVAHDFNNLLTVIIGNSEFLLSRHQAGDPSFREINDIHQNAIRAANLVRQLLAFSRQQTMQPKVLDLRVVTSELGELLRRLLREGIDMRIEQGEDLWPVYADEAQLTNAIINLVVNARDAMPNGGTLTLRTANESLQDATSIGSATMKPGDYVRIDVADSGIGIPKEYVGKIFEPFFTTKPTGQGTGLGLATVYGIVKQTGGFISVESEVGRGTTFSVYLPRHHGEVEARAEAAPLRDITGEETILLVEDEDGVRSFAARALKQRGYKVLEASGGEQALEIVRARADDIALIITDVVMPNMDGPTLVRAARKLKPDVHVIFMSGYAEEAFRRNDEKAEDLHFLPKPFGLKQLAAKVKDVLSGVSTH